MSKEEQTNNEQNTTSVTINKFEQLRGKIKNQISQSLHNDFMQKMNKNKWKITAGSLAMASVALAVGIGSYYDLGVQVTINDNVLCVAQSQGEVVQAMMEVQNDISTALGEPYALKVEPTYQLTLAKSGTPKNAKDMETSLMDYATDVAMLTVLKVDGKTIGATDNQNALENMLMQIKSRYTTGNPNERVEFDREVVIKNQLCKIDKKKTISEIRNVLESVPERGMAHTMTEVENASVIAPRFGMSVGDLVPLSGGMPAAGEPLATNAQQEPLLKVRTIQTQEYEEAIWFETIEVADQNMYKSEKEVITEGVEGIRFIKKDVVFINGIEAENIILEDVVLLQPTTEVVRVGTKALPLFGGQFMLPTNGRFTSEFGARWGSTHTGLDIANSAGTSIYASESGTVIKASNNGTYGNCIIIDHGNGIETLYGHNSELLVSVGDAVAKGQLIALMGSTGRSTGNHCHFEIRIHGDQVNPRLYVGGKTEIEIQ